MNMKKTIMSLLFLLGVMSASAQVAQEATAAQKGTTEYEFNPHWYVMVQPLGMQYTLGEGKFGDMLSYNVQAAIGYNFSKIFGARLSVNAWQSKGDIELDDKDLTQITPNEFSARWKWNYIAPSIELTANLMNIFSYKPERLFNLYAFAGVGANFGFSNDEAADVKNQVDAYWKNIEQQSYDIYQFTRIHDKSQNMEYLWDGSKTRFIGKFGLIFDFRVNDKVSINLETNANVISDKYNSKNAGNADWYFNALAGVKVNLGKTHTSKFVPAPEPEIRYIEKEKIVERVVKEPCDEVKPTAAVQMREQSLRREVFFAINKTQVTKTEEQKVKDIANYLKNNPKAKVTLTGYADAGTGNNKINDRLSKLRAQAVQNMLIKQYNIAPERIHYTSKGSREQVFKENDKNRVTICIAQ